MPRFNRAYKKGEPHRDSRLFVVVAEGEREDAYFRYFNRINSRIQVLLIPRKPGESSPKHFTDRILTAEDSGQYSPKDNDSVWFVCDVDRWQSQLHDLKIRCEATENWNLVISNPCFEVWLHYHSGPIVTGELNCQRLKEQLPTTQLGHFNVKTYCDRIWEASHHSEQADISPDNDFPELMQTKVYRLAKEIHKLLGAKFV